MRNNHLHIISFDVPYPPDYGGVIDVFYKIKTLHSKGIRLHLHIIEYPGRERAPELEQYCESINYYPRKLGIKSAFSIYPYIVQSRKSPEMIDNLLMDDYPILFEGLHSCYYIDDPRLANRLLIYRESNIEHHYYYNLFKATRHWGQKTYFLVESIKLLFFQKKLKHAQVMLVVSKGDRDYLQSKFPGKKIYFLPSFHGNEEVRSIEGKGDYFLYHGNIEVPENEAAASFLIRKVFSSLNAQLIIAGKNPPENIKRLASKTSNVTLITNPDDEKLFRLIREAQANILVTFQASGLKLKLLNTLYNGRFCIVNKTMLNGTGLENLCVVANTPQALKNAISEISNTTFSTDIAKERERLLQQDFSNTVNADRLISIILDN